MDKTTNKQNAAQSNAPHSNAPLRGLKVVELARILAGPMVGQTLADLGAEVIKVEAPQGDDTRQWGPPFVTRQGGDQGEEPDDAPEAAYYHTANRGKKSVCCDFKNAGDLEKLKHLITQADVLVENFKTGGLKKFGLDYESLKALNPRLVYLSITGFGHTGPRAAEPGYDFLIQGMCGIMDLTGEADRDPQKIGVAWIDIFTGLYGVIAVQAALRERELSGLGQHIDLSLFDVGVAGLANLAMNYLTSGQVPHRIGNTHPSIVPYQTVPVKDGHIIITAGNDRQFNALCDVLGVSEWAHDPRFATNPTRVKNRVELTQMLNAKTRQWQKQDLIAALIQAGVPGGPVNTVAEALDDEQIRARGLQIEVEGVQALRTPIDFSRSQLVLGKAAPRLGSGKWEFEGEFEG